MPDIIGELTNFLSIRFIKKKYCYYSSKLCKKICSYN